MDFSSEQYLPMSGERIEHLQKIVNGRPVAILASGPSIKELENRIDELRNADICYFSLKNCMHEKQILNKIDKQTSVLMNPNLATMALFLDDNLNFLNRRENNMFISTFGRSGEIFDLLGNDFDRDKFLSKYDKKLLFFGLSYDRSVPNKSHPLHFISGNSLQMLIQIAIIGKASRIVLFGADGGPQKNVKELYYNPDQCKPELREKSKNESRPEIIEHIRNTQRVCVKAITEDLITDTRLCFNPIMPLAVRNVYKTYNLTPIDILNCSENSHYTPFPKISYDTAFECLRKNKNFDIKSDLRVPKLSIIIIAVGESESLKETIESVSKQSYPNYEHIVVDRGTGYLQALKKGVSKAKGKYISFCSAGDSYTNQDWLNICIEILENHLNISLVWGMTQDVTENGACGRINNSEFFDNPPPQEKEFIYYWLKKKILFPAGNFCVRKHVFEECFPFNDKSIKHENKAWLSFNYNFNISGYLPFFVPLVANYRRTYFDQGGHRPQGDPIKMHLPYYVPITEKERVRSETEDDDLNMMLNAYRDNIQQYRSNLIKGKNLHHYKDGNGKILPDSFSRRLLFCNIQSYAKKKYTKRIRVSTRIINAYKKQGLGIFKAGATKIADYIIRVIKGRFPWISSTLQFRKKQ